MKFGVSEGMVLAASGEGPSLFLLSPYLVRWLSSDLSECVRRILSPDCAHPGNARLDVCHPKY